MLERKIRVLQLIDGFTVGGAERIVLMLAMHTNRERFQVIPCALHRSGPIEEELKAAGVEYRVLGIQRRSVLTGPPFLFDLRRILVALRKMLKELSIDIVHAHLTQSTLMGILAARRVATPRVCATVHNIVIHNQRGRLSPREWLMRNAINRVFSRADRIIAVSEEVAQAVKLGTRIPRERIVTIPNGIDAERYRFNGDRRILRRELDLPTDRLMALTVGRLTRQKGYPHLLTALSLIPFEKRPLTLIAGDGPDRPALEEKAKTLKIADDVRFLGNRHDIPDLLGAADVFVLSSLWEGLPLALLEAMASGLPAVVTAVGGNTEAVMDGESGVLVPPADEKALAKALSSLLGDALKLEQMGRAAREQFDYRFSLQSFVEAHERLYEEMLSGRPRHPETTALHEHTFR